MRAILIFICLFMVAGALAQGAPDSDHDGYPDADEITGAADRAAFMGWFATIAESQYTAMSPAWQPQDRDCAGLLRFAFIEALKPKTAAWFAQFPFLSKTDIPPVEGLSYPMPIISRSVFRDARGPYEPGDVEAGKLVGRASAGELLNYDVVFLGRTPDKAERGDLLFFVHPLAEGSGYHSMVYLGGGMVVYHTGLSPEDGGEVRLLSLQTLDSHPDPSWHAVPDNPDFLGFFRWKILE